MPSDKALASRPAAEPAPALASVVERIVAELRERARYEAGIADSKRAKVSGGHNTLDTWSHEKNDHAEAALAEEADRIEAEHGKAVR